MLSDIVARSRSYRRFLEAKPVDRALLVELVGLARLCPTARNLQPLKFFISHDEALNSRIFPCLAWAGYLKDWSGPAEGERPSAYIVLLEDSRISEITLWEQGIVAQTIMLGATERGLGGCIVASVKRSELAQTLNIPEHLRVVLALALGYPSEEVVIEPMPGTGSVEYWRDAQGVHHVPKRSLDELIVG